MGLLFGRSSTRPAEQRGTLQDIGVPSRTLGSRGTPASGEEALRFSALWAALRLRADLISTLPLDVFRYDQTGAQVPAPPTRLFRAPADGMLWNEWVYASQMDLDRYGNFCGHIVARENGYPVQVEPWPMAQVTALMDGYRIRAWRYRGKEFDPADVWHEKQYMVAGLKVGLSPLAYAAWAIGTGLAAQDFSLDWFANGAHPTGTLRHTEAANLDPVVLQVAKARFKEATANRDIFATGKEWEYSPAAVDANSAQFLEQVRATAVDVARFIGVPADSIDAAVSGSSVTYANVTQRQLSLLVNNINPPVVRREAALTTNALPAPRFAKFNTDALLRLDPTGRTDLMGKQVDAWLMTPNEGRALLNMPPLTDDDIALLQLRQTKTAAAIEEAPSDDQ